MKIDRVQIFATAAPLSPPVVTARGRFDQRVGALVRLVDEAGVEGFGEAAPWPGFGGHGARFEAALEALRAADPAHWGVLRSPEAAADVAASMGSPEVAFAVEVALLDLLGRRLGKSVAGLLCEAPRGRVEVHALVNSAEEAARARSAGFGRFKVKVGLDGDEARVASIREAIGQGALRLDANGAWSAQEAIERLGRLSRYGIELVEQPVKANDIAGLARVRAEAGVPVAADEALTGIEALESLIEAEAVDAIVLKPAFTGGIGVARRMARRAASAGIGVMVTHALEGVVGRLAALHLAASLPGPLLACGLGGPRLEVEGEQGAGGPVEQSEGWARRVERWPRPCAAGGWVEVPQGAGLCGEPGVGR